MERLESLREFYWLLKSQSYYRAFFGRIGRGAKILNPMRLRNVQNIYLGDHVLVNKHSFLLTLQIDVSKRPRLVIDEGSVIGHMNHITAVNDVYIGKKVLTADRVHISDNAHSFLNPDVPILEQEVVCPGPVAIGDGTWIGENASILSCKIGRNCVVGSNAVVTRDVPDYSVVVGIPARVVKQFDPASKKWIRVGQEASR